MRKSKPQGQRGDGQGQAGLAPSRRMPGRSCASEGPRQGERHLDGSAGARLNARALAQICRDVIIRAGITGRGRGPHTLRHTFATWYLKRGGHLLALKEILGHKNLSQTLVYVHLSRLRRRRKPRIYSPIQTLGLMGQNGRWGGTVDQLNGTIGPINITSMSNSVRNITSGRDDVGPSDDPQAYGRYYYVKPLDQRGSSMQKRVPEALVAFQGWRRHWVRT